MAQFKRTLDNPRKEATVERNANKKRKPKKKRPRRRFIAVDVWQKQFGPVSERAVYDVFAQKFNIELHNMRKYSFPDCVNALRKLEDPTYVAPTYGSGTTS